MKSTPLLLYVILFLVACNPSSDSTDVKVPDIKSKYAMVIHGGAGYYDFGKNAEMDSAYINSLQAVIQFGDSLLATGLKAIDIVEACISMMEDNPLFNAGKGSVLNEAGVVSMDASIMDGSNEMAGAVAGMSSTRHPISAARRVMDSTVHVFLSGEGAEKFAAQQQLEQMPPSWFVTEKSMDVWKKEAEKIKEAKFGTVGCVVLDKHGNLAAGTSTGGMSMKKWGRIGDAPVIGAGTYASNSSCGISCTGHGEYFIRNVVAYDVSARMSYLKESINEAADFIIKSKLANQDAKGGLIGIDKDGNICMSFNTPSMFRAYIKEGEQSSVFIK